MVNKPFTLIPLLLAALTASASAAELEVEVQGLATGAQGQVLLAAYADAATWLKGRPVAVARADASAAKDGRLLLNVKDLPDGAPVAITLFHDRNGNGRLDMNAMGMPLEPYGFSRDAVGNFGPPGFEQALIAPGAGRIVVHLN